MQINKNTPNDVKRNPEKYPEFPKQLEGISDIEHCEAISSYWRKISLDKQKKEHQEKMKRITNFYMFDNLWLESLQLWCFLNLTKLKSFFSPTLPVELNITLNIKKFRTKALLT